MTILFVLAAVCVLTWIWLFWAGAKHDRLVTPLTTDDWSTFPPFDEEAYALEVSARPARPESVFRSTEAIASAATDTSYSPVTPNPHRGVSATSGLVKARCAHLVRRHLSKRF